MSKRDRRVLEDLHDRVQALQHEAELMRTVLIVKEPNTVQAAEAYDGLRKQLGAAAAERRSHLNQLVSMAVAVKRVELASDVAPMVREWMDQAGIVELHDVPAGANPKDVFEDVSGDGLASSRMIEVLEPAYVDSQTGSLLRLGRARPAGRLPRGERAARQAGDVTPEPRSPYAPHAVLEETASASPTTAEPADHTAAEQQEGGRA